MQPHLRICALLGGLAALGGCAPASWASAPQVKAPVLLSRVDCIGGHVPDWPARVVGVVSAEVGRVATSNSTQHGDVVVTQTTVQDTTSFELSRRLNAAAGHDSDVDVHVDRLDAGSYFFFLAGYAKSERWVGVDARAFKKEQSR